MQLEFGVRPTVTWCRGFCSAGVPPAIVVLASYRKTAGETPALQNLALYYETRDHRSAHENRGEMSELGD
jgi:hypothetical protein